MATAKKAAARKVLKKRVLLPTGDEAKEPPVLGRPSLYRPEFDDRVKTLSIAGFSHERMAEVLGIHVQTLRLWMNTHESFLEAIKFGSDQADANVERALYELATGYSHPDTDIRTVSIGDGCSEIIQTPIVKHYPPNATAIIFQLSNKNRVKWKRGDPGVGETQSPESIARAAQAAIAALDHDE